MPAVAERYNPLVSGGDVVGVDAIDETHERDMVAAVERDLLVHSE